MRSPRSRVPLLTTLAAAVLLLGAGAAGPAHAEGAQPAASASPKAKTKPKPKTKPKKKPTAQAEDPAFAARLAALKAQEGVSVVAIKMKPTDNPDILPDAPGMGMGMGAGPVLVAGKRGGIYTPPILSPDDILDVVNAEMKTIRRCYKQQLEVDPEWADELILDLSVKKTGRVAEVSIAPRRVMRAEIGRCLMTHIPKWKFPTFTGELDDGMTQEVVSASFPFSFSAP